MLKLTCISFWSGIIRLFDFFFLGVILEFAGGRSILYIFHSNEGFTYAKTCPAAFLLVLLWELQWPLAVSLRLQCWQGAESTCTWEGFFRLASPSFSGCTLPPRCLGDPLPSLSLR